jgi:chemotaxis response regulator CheB
MNSFAKDFPIVCVGGSAGGTSAYAQLLKHLPPETCVAIVIVNHKKTTPASLQKILPRSTKMPVELIVEGLRIQPNHVFIIPTNCDLHVLGGTFRLSPISKPKGWPNVITVFLRSLAQNWDGKLVAVIVSGLDADGAEALREIKAAGGITIAQSPDSAEWSDMPANAIKTGRIDFILSVKDIAQKIVQIANAFPRKAI